jgi:hypothetical protein
MSGDVEVEIVGDEVVITKHADTEEARGTVAAIRRAVELFNKNTDDFTAEAYRDPDAADDGEDEDDDDEIDGGEPAARRRARRLQRDPAALAAALVGERTEKRSETMTADAMIESIKKSGCAIAILKRFVKEGKDAWSEFQITKILTDHWGADFAKNLQAQTPEGLLARRALEQARNAQFIDAYYGKADHTVSLEPAVVAGREATAVNRPTAADRARERIIAEKRAAAPFMSDEQLAAYADSMIEHLGRIERRA